MVVRVRQCGVVALASIGFFISTASGGAQSLNLDAGGFLSVVGPSSSSFKSGPAFVAGPEGFTFQGVVTGAGSKALLQCGDPGCKAGTTVSLGANFSPGNDLRGTATYRGATYRSVGSVSSFNSLAINTSGSIVLPPVADSVTISAPFSFDGVFSYEAADRSGQRVPFTGNGTAVLSLSRYSDFYADSWKIDNITYYVASPLPNGWMFADVGHVGQPGRAGHSNGTFDLAGSGADIWGTADAFHYAVNPLTGDGSITARVLTEQDTNPFAKAGVMLRSGFDAGAPHVILDVKPNGEVEFMTRSAAAGNTAYLAGASPSFPVWLRLTRSGNAIAGAYSSDGVTWSDVGTTSAIAPPLPPTVLAGLVVTSHDNGALNQSLFDKVAVDTTIGSDDGPLNRSDWTVLATESAPGDPPSNAIDGNLNTRFSTGNAQHDSQGFIVSWTPDRTIGRIRMEVGPSTNDYPRTCGIWVKDSAGNVTFVNCVADASGNVDVSFTPLPVNKIEVWQWGTSSWWWSIAEFNVFSAR